jgi:membrane protease YdiL (CAAX protease family)
VICAIFIVLLTPLQAAAEEYVFRGLLAQAIGAWVRFVPVAIIVPTILFASLHIYDVWGLLDVFVFGIAASLVVWRTGGLESAIAMHSVNNVAIFLLLASGSLGTTVNEATAGSPVSLGISVVTMALWVLWISWLARRRGIARLGAWAPAPPAPTA